MNEFEIIERYFKRSTQPVNDILVGAGDDAAVLAATGRSRVVCTDTLNEGIHFPEKTPAGDIAYKALAVNLSDLAAMGAVPKFALLALSLPAADENWLDAFAKDFFKLAKQFGVELIGGDLTRGPLSVNVTLIGEPCNGNYLTRSGAQVGDTIYITGTLGGAGEALRCIKKKKPLSKTLYQSFYRPFPQVEMGIQLSHVATSAIDISDGLLADLQHILEASHVGACLNLKAIPCVGDRDKALTAGEDYALCFTASAHVESQIQAIAEKCSSQITAIGEIVSGEPAIFDLNKKKITTAKLGYQHFGGSGENQN